MSARPATLGELFMAFMGLALRGFGGVLPWAHRTLVEERGWLGRADFVELLTLAHTLPGPNVVNVAVMVGDRWFGWRGAVVAVAGLVAAPALIVLALAIGYARLADVPQARQAVAGMAAVAAGLVIATGLKLGAPLRRDATGLAFAAAALVGVGLLRWPLPWVLAGLAPAAVGAAWWRQRAGRAPASPNAAGAAPGAPGAPGARDGPAGRAAPDDSPTASSASPDLSDDRGDADDGPPAGAQR